MPASLREDELADLRGVARPQAKARRSGQWAGGRDVDPLELRDAERDEELGVRIVVEQRAGGAFEHGAQQHRAAAVVVVELAGWMRHRLLQHVAQAIGGRAASGSNCSRDPPSAFVIPSRQTW
jgi:hypothetical protein